MGKSGQKFDFSAIRTYVRSNLCPSTDHLGTQSNFEFFTLDTEFHVIPLVVAIVTGTIEKDKTV